MRDNRIVKTLIIVVLLVFLILNSRTITSAIRIRVTDAGAGLLESIHIFPSVLKKIVPFASLREENAILRDRVNMLTRRLDELEMVNEENERLKGLLAFRKTIPYTTMPCQVIGRDSSNWSNSLIINKGYNDGIRQNKAVLSTKGLVGRVMEVGRHSARILLITDPNSKVGVVIERNRQGGILLGRPDGRCKMIYIALDSDVAAGDKVLCAGYGVIFPKDILVGEVVKIAREPGRLYKYAIVKTAEELSKLEEVLCIR